MGKGLGFLSDYPKHVFLILGNEFCERFSFYGMKAILVIFLNRALRYSEDTSTTIYHSFNMACYFTPIFGAMLADGLIGKYKTILYISIIYVVGNFVMSMSAIPFEAPKEYTPWATFLGLALIACGTGGIKPCVNAFGADQFRDDQTKEKDSFFSMFYVSINMGSLLSMILTPILRSNVKCFEDDCYALAFGIPAALMLLALNALATFVARASAVFFIAGTRMYTIVPPGNNIIGKMVGCVWTGLTGRCTKKGPPRDHWLDYADVKYEESFITDVKMALKVMLMFVTFPIFWALYDQQGSRWILQAGQMNGDIGGFIIEPDLVPVINPILVLILVPICESIVYPIMDKCRCCYTALQRVGLGMFLCSMSFVVTGCLQIAINASEPSPVDSGFSRIQPINAAPCDLHIELVSGKIDPVFMKYKQESTSSDIPFGTEIFTATYMNCIDEPMEFNQTQNLTVVLKNEKTYPIIFTKHGAILQATAFEQTQTKRTLRGESTAMLINAVDEDFDIKIQAPSDEAEPVKITPAYSLGNGSYADFPAGQFDVFYKLPGNDTDYDLPDNGTKYLKVGSFESKAGRVLAVVLQNGTEGLEVVSHTLISANSVPILLQIPQYFIMTLSEVFFIITGMNFAYSQAPMTMKAVLQAALLLTSTFGNLIVVIISGAELDDRVFEFFLFAGLMFVTTILFAIMAHFYEYVTIVPEEDETQAAEEIPPGAPRKGSIPKLFLERGVSHSSVRSRARTNSSVYSYLGEGTKL